MKYMVIDTELSRLPDFKLPADHADQARLAQFAAILIENGTEIDRFHAYVKPDGWVVDGGANAVNGLTNEFLDEVGGSIKTILDFYEARLKEGYIVVAHNANSDLKTMRGELRRAGRPDHFAETPSICTMRSLTKHCGLINSRGAPKWPKLGEAHEHCFGKPLPVPAAASLKAMRDAEACRDLLFEMGRISILPEPHTPGAKED